MKRGNAEVWCILRPRKSKIHKMPRELLHKPQTKTVPMALKIFWKHMHTNIIRNYRGPEDKSVHFVLLTRNFVLAEL